MFMKNVIFILTVVLLYSNLFSQSCNETFSGEGTFYGYGGGGNCSFANPTSPVYTGAMNELQYDTAMTCGACVEVTGSRGSLVIRIEDKCPECKFGDIDLSEEAFPLIDDKIKGRVPITWKFVPCSVQGGVKFYFKEGSSQWWTAVQVRNHKYPVVKLEYKVNNQWVNMPRQMYNYFLVESGMGLGPFSFRITDMYGDVIEEDNIPFVVTTEINGVNQFPNCDGSSTILVTGITLSSDVLSISSGSTSQLTSTIVPSKATNKTVMWSTSNAAIATVNTAGLVTGGSVGSAIVTATTQDGAKTATCNVTVTSDPISVTGVGVQPTATTIGVGADTQLIATVTPSNATNKTVVWSTSNAAVATVNATGVVIGVAAGSAIVTAITQDGAKIATCSVTVTTPSSCSFGTPLRTGLPSIVKTFNHAHVLGEGGSSLSNVGTFVINWELAKNGLYQMAINTNDGNPNWYVDLLPNTTQTFGSAQPSITFLGTGVAGLDGSYWAAVDNENLVFVSKNGGYSIYLSNSATPPTCAKSANSISATGNKDIVKFYPNPFSNEVTLITDANNINSVEVYDQMGKIILKLDKKMLKSSPIRFGRDLPAGIYVVKVNQNNYKLIKQ